MHPHIPQALLLAAALGSTFLTRAPAAESPAPPSFDNSLGMRLLRVAPGEFRMGADEPTPPALGGPKHLPRGDWDERPVHPVRLTRPYYLAETEVTEAQFQRFRPDFHSLPGAGPGATGVTYTEAVAFCQWLSKQERKPYRLPTEAEWEYACRAGSQTPFWSGPTPPEASAPNAWGFRGMHAAPPEWCADWHGPYPSAAQTDPVGRAAGVARVVRGGGLQESTPYYARSANRGGTVPEYAGALPIGFRVVQAPAPAGKPLPEEVPFVRQCVRQDTELAKLGPDPARPYLRIRPLLPTPPEDAAPEAVRAAGLHPAFLDHNHSPSLVACPNGDLLAVYYTSHDEYTPDVALMASRLRFGADEWDMPDLLLDLPDVNDHAPLLWNDGGVLRLFWGGPGAPNVPFRTAVSRDNGATFTDFRFVQLSSQPAAGYTPQPINTAFRGPDGAMYVPTDGVRGTSVLWRSRDEGRTWADAGGRTAGRHTTFALRKDGSILGMGGKVTDIGGFMPQAVSTDQGKSWSVSKSPFPALTNVQRPSVLRLASGRLLFLSDYQNREGKQPAGIPERGSFVTLSEDDGKTWLPWRKLPAPSGARSLGYSAARQGPNGLIHLITSVSAPALHYELNEAWILAGGAPVPPPAGSGKLLEGREPAGRGKSRATWSGSVAPDGRYLLQGLSIWRYPNGRKQWEATYRDGKKVGAERYWSAEGKLLWLWDYASDGSAVWTRWSENGHKLSESTWKDHRADGPATTWSEDGAVLTHHNFRGGIPKP